MPPEVVARAKIILLDTLGAILPASDPAYPGSRALFEMARMLGGEPQIIKINASSSYAGKGMDSIFKNTRNRIIK